ncbi:hypothetical protein SAMN02982994_6641 [Azospirillum lipoferum]|nr:hypothetical protein SAMN02982994_6641 [Azospirillum lipoferum]
MRALLDRPLRPNGKITIQQGVRLSYNFALGLPLASSAEATGLSRKSVREMSVEFREHLTQPAFNEWHRSNVLLVGITDPEQEALIRTTFFDVLGECHGNETCYRNYRLGNRKARLCRKCPLPAKLKHAETVTAATEAIDLIHRFYEGLGWRGEGGRDPVQLFRRRFIHTSAIATARANTRMLPNGAADPRDSGFLSVNTLARKLVNAFCEGE